MQENLKGRTILVGKEPDKGRLLVSVKINGQPKTAAIGLPDSVPNTVSRCMAQQDVAHCSIDVAPGGTMTVINLKPRNVTFVNGVEVIKKVIKESDSIALGKDRYAVNLQEVLATASKIIDVVAPPPPVTVSIKPLEAVWDEYDTYLTNQKIANGRFAALASASGLFTIGSFVLTAVPNVNPNIRYVMYGIAFILILVTIVKRLHDATRLPRQQKEALQRFQKQYACPSCHHFVGNLPYDLLRQNKSCPYCRCKWTED